MAGADNLIGKGFDAHPENINRKGRPKKLPKLETLIAEVLSEEKNGVSGIKAIIMAMSARAINNKDPRAAELLLERYYGKLKQIIQTLEPVETPEIDFKKLTPEEVKIFMALKEKAKIEDIPGSDE
jgi:hypothetical protein